MAGIRRLDQVGHGPHTRRRADSGPRRDRRPTAARPGRRRGAERSGGQPGRVHRGHTGDRAAHPRAQALADRPRRTAHRRRHCSGSGCPHFGLEQAGGRGLARPSPPPRPAPNRRSEATRRSASPPPGPIASRSRVGRSVLRQPSSRTANRSRTRARPVPPPLGGDFPRPSARARPWDRRLPLDEVARKQRRQDTEAATWR